MHQKDPWKQSGVRHLEFLSIVVSWCIYFTPSLPSATRVYLLLGAVAQLHFRFSTPSSHQIVTSATGQTSESEPNFQHFQCQNRNGK